MSVYVTDTHALLWYFTGQHRMLSKRAFEAFEHAENSEAFIYIPVVSLWEVSRLDHLGAIRLHEPFEDWVDALSAQPCFEFVPIDDRVILQSRKYNFNRDIFDAAIVATAIVKDLPLITRETQSPIQELLRFTGKVAMASQRLTDWGDAATFYDALVEVEKA